MFKESFNRTKKLLNAIKRSNPSPYIFFNTSNLSTEQADAVNELIGSSVSDKFTPTVTDDTKLVQARARTKFYNDLATSLAKAKKDGTYLDLYSQAVDEQSKLAARTVAELVVENKGLQDEMVESVAASFLSDDIEAGKLVSEASKALSDKLKAATDRMEAAKRAYESSAKKANVTREELNRWTQAAITGKYTGKDDTVMEFGDDTNTIPANVAKFTAKLNQ